MLARTLRKVSATSAAAPPATSHAADHGHAIATAVSPDRLAHYMRRKGTVGFHAHAEPNFRKRPMGLKGWTDPKLCDPYQPFMQQTPVRHVDRGVANGMWFGLGHFALKNHFGVGNWRFAARLFLPGGTGISFALFFYSVRMSRNGWQWKNRGAVYGMD